MTPQEALEKFGYILFGSENSYKPGDVLQGTDTHAVVETEVKFVVTGEASGAEVDTFISATGWFPIGPRFYKVIAE